MHDDPYKPGVLLVGSLESAVRGDQTAVRAPASRVQTTRRTPGRPAAAVATTRPSRRPGKEQARHQVLIEEIRLKQDGDVVDPSKVTKEDVAPILVAVDA
ncbi:hypothetical protein PG996_001575 [Apiospora saccharicola]|uniref:Uncharacterized protein n=1 Tax=Apiospora saccharicola TaxID=335842 RepID=A0ABR1WH14_9PEZI